MLTDENRKTILDRLLSTIYDISDVEYQKRVWIRGEGPEVDDFGETINFFFDDIELVFKDYKAYGVSESQYQLLLQFRDAFDSFRDEYYHPLEFIDTSEWETIMKMAKEVTEAFHYKKDPEAFKRAREKDLLFYRLIDTVFRLSSYQKENVWILKESKESDFTLMASFFLEKGKLILDNYKDYGLFDYHYQALKRFYDAFEVFSQAHSFGLEFTKTSEWDKVKAIAQDTLAIFHYTPKSHFDGYSEKPWV